MRYLEISIVAITIIVILCIIYINIYPKEYFTSDFDIFEPMGFSEYKEEISLEPLYIDLKVPTSNSSIE